MVASGKSRVKVEDFKLTYNSSYYGLKEGQVPNFEDKTSDSYVPKTYRSQSKLGLLMTQWLDKYLGIRFKNPIKWQNTISILLAHFLVLYIFFTWPMGIIKWQGWPWGKFFEQKQCPVHCLALNCISLQTKLLYLRFSTCQRI